MLFLTCKKPSESANAPPTCKITNPQNNAQIEKGTDVVIAVEAEDDDGDIDEVRFFIDGIGAYSTTAFPFNYTWNTSEVTVGDHTIKAIAIDNGKDETSAEVTVTITLQNVLSGYVKNSLGDPIAGAEVSISLSKATSKVVSSDENSSQFFDNINNTISQDLVEQYNEEDKSNIELQSFSRIKKTDHSLSEILLNDVEYSFTEYKLDVDKKNIIEQSKQLAKSSELLTSVITDENGYYEFIEIESGNYIFEIFANYYSQYSTSVQVGNGVVQHDVNLTAEELQQVSSISLSDGSYKVRVSWTEIDVPIVKGYNIYERHYLMWESNLSEDKDYWYREFSDWEKANTNPIVGNSYNFDSEEYNAVYQFYILPVNIDNVETAKNSDTDIDGIELTYNLKELIDFALTDLVGPVHIPQSTHEVALYMRYYYEDVLALFALNGQWSVQGSTDGSSWFTIATHYIPTSNPVKQYYGYTETFSINS